VLGGTGGFAHAIGALYFDGYDTYVPGGTGRYADEVGLRERSGSRLKGTFRGEIRVPNGDGSTRTIRMDAGS
jgi:hypothetical protein